MLLLWIKSLVERLPIPEQDMSRLSEVREDGDYEWTPECQSSFDKIKATLSLDLLLAHYDPNLPIITDHKPHVAIFGTRKGIPIYSANRLQRWVTILLNYNFTIELIQRILDKCMHFHSSQKTVDIFRYLLYPPKRLQKPTL
ncbi:unnamed protein product [Nippostrongylus brasiliensis]|uniref:RT_RNaseH domain-containing protein n=1 Tax=Nippostrongylus brasiliensis TaxID=27835 RepID=A0A0N4YK03_NIPBR|nr:unnamed protein product [Nippostrongylus brasiliensis]